MAVTAYSIDNAEWTFTDDIQTVRSDQGYLFQQRFENPWAFLRFADVGEERKYVVPFNGAAWTSQSGTFAMRSMLVEVMPFQPFPLESARQPRTSGGPTVGDNAGGPVAVHFYGWV